MEKVIMTEYARWHAMKLDDPDLTEELNAIEGNPEEINDRFYRELEFGTGGLRGVIGAGTNRINIYTVRKATQGLANYLNKKTSHASVAIAYDSRIKSDVFAKAAAEVLAANGITAHLYPQLMPTPALSFAVRHLKCDARVFVLLQAIILQNITDTKHTAVTVVRLLWKWQMLFWMKLTGWIFSVMSNTWIMMPQ